MVAHLSANDRRFKNHRLSCKLVQSGIGIITPVLNFYSIISHDKVSNVLRLAESAVIHAADIVTVW